MNLLSQHIECFLCFSSFVIIKYILIKTIFPPKVTIFFNINLLSTSKVLSNDIILSFWSLFQ